MSDPAPTSGDSGCDVVCYSPTGQMLFSGKLQSDGVTVQLVTVPDHFFAVNRYGPDGIPNHSHVRDGYFTPTGGFAIQYTSRGEDGTQEVPMAGCTYQVREGAQTLTYKVGLNGDTRLVAISVVSDGTTTIPYGDGTMTVPKDHVVTTDDSGRIFIDGTLVTARVLAPAAGSGSGSGSRPGYTVDQGKLRRQVTHLRVELSDLTELGGSLQDHAVYVGQVAADVDAALEGVRSAMGNDIETIGVFMGDDAYSFLYDWPKHREACVTSIRTLGTLLARLAEQLGYTARVLQATEQANLDTISRLTGVDVRGLMTDPGTAPPPLPGPRGRGRGPLAL